MPQMLNATSWLFLSVDAKPAGKRLMTEVPHDLHAKLSGALTDLIVQDGGAIGAKYWCAD